MMQSHLDEYRQPVLITINTQNDVRFVTNCHHECPVVVELFDAQIF